MKVAIVGAGFTAAEADQLRRAMATFKFTGGVSHFSEKLIGGMVERGYPREFAERTFRQLEGFGSYGFPESHAASFAKISYASSWMKHHHPDVFCAALLNAQPMGFYPAFARSRVARCSDARVDVPEVRLALRCLPPHCPEKRPLALYWDSGSQTNGIGRAQGVTAAFNGIIHHLRRAGCYEEATPPLAAQRACAECRAKQRGLT